MPGPGVFSFVSGRVTEECAHLLRARTAAALWTLGDLCSDLCGPVFIVENRDNRAVVPSCSSES